MTQIFIAGNVPSSKNSKRIARIKNKRGDIVATRLINSEVVEKYLKTYAFQWHFAGNVAEFHRQIKGKEKPYKVGFYFIRDSRRKFDYINAMQLPCDLMVKAGWIDDDNANEIIPVCLGYEVDKGNAGVRIEVLE